LNIRIRQIAKWALLGLAVIVVLFGLYLSLFFLPYPLFPHHMEHAGFSAYSDREIPQEFELILEDARFRVEGMELYRGDRDLRLFFCFSQRKFENFVKLSGKRYAGQALVISVAGNAFFSKQGEGGRFRRAPSWRKKFRNKDRSKDGSEESEGGGAETSPPQSSPQSTRRSVGPGSAIQQRVTETMRNF